MFHLFLPLDPVYKGDRFVVVLVVCVNVTFSVALRRRRIFRVAYFLAARLAVIDN